MMKKYIFIYIIFICSHQNYTSEKYGQDAITQTNPNFQKLPKHLQNLYVTYQKLYEVTIKNQCCDPEYQYKPTYPAGIRIMKDLKTWHQCIEDYIENKNIDEAKALDLIQTLQRHKKEAQHLINVFLTYNQEWDNDQPLRKACIDRATKDINSLINSEEFEYQIIKNLFAQDLVRMTTKQESKIKKKLNARGSYSQMFSQKVPNNHLELLQDYPELQFYELEQNEGDLRYQQEKEEETQFTTIYHNFKDKRHEYQTWNFDAYINDCKRYGMPYVNPANYWENK